MTGRRRRRSTTSGGGAGPTQTARLCVRQKSSKKLATRWRGGQTQTAQDSLRPERVWERRQVHVHHPDGQRLRSGCMPLQDGREQPRALQPITDCKSDRFASGHVPARAGWVWRGKATCKMVSVHTSPIKCPLPNGGSQK